MSIKSVKIIVMDSPECLRREDLKAKAFPEEDRSFLDYLAENGATKPIEADDTNLPLPDLGIFYPDEPHKYTPPER